MPTPNEPTQLQQATLALDNFEKSAQAGVWPNLDKKTVIADMRSRLADPFKVNQGGQPFCGPASILFELVRKQPLRYVQICQSLFETGSFQGQTRRIETSSRLRTSRGRLQMAQADWMVLATLRDAENLIFPVDPDAPDIIRNLAGITKPWEMQGWTREVLGYPKVKHTITYIYGEVTALQQAAQINASGGVTFALVTAEGLLQGKPPLLPYPDHWITLLGNISIKAASNFANLGSTHLSCDLYTWGEKRHIDVDQNPLENCFWGIVTGQL